MRSYSAILTNATSSGLDAWYTFYPLSSTGVTLWQTANAVIISLTTVLSSLSLMTCFLFVVIVLFNNAVAIAYFSAKALSATSASGPLFNLHYFMRIFVILARCESVNVLFFKQSLLNTISFCVNVPVLSLRINCTLPSSSGIYEFRVTVPSISWSLFMLYANNIFAASRFTRSEIGMIDESNNTNLK